MTTNTLSNIVKTQSEESRIDLTPMLDVVFILLIFFVVTAIQFDGSSMPLESQEPQPEQPLTEDQPQNILFEIQANNRLVFNGETIDQNAVRARVLQVLAQNPGASAIIKATSESVANDLVYVIDETKRAGVDKIRISE